MKTCPECSRNYPDEYGFCLDDGSALSGPLEGEKTQLLKGPFAPGGTTEEIKAAVSEETIPVPAQHYVPAPTEPSPQLTIKSDERPPVEAPPKVQPPGNDPGRARKASTANWVLGSAFLLAVVGLIVVFMNDQPSPVSNTNAPTNTHNPLQSRAITPSGNTAASNTQPVAIRPGQPLVAPGMTEAETSEEEMLAHDKHGFVVWSVKPGDFVEQCGGGSFGLVTRYNDVQREGGGTFESKTNDTLTWTDPVVVLSLDVSNAQSFRNGQRLARLGKILHMWVNVNFQPSDTGRLVRGLRAVFTDTGHTRDFNGTVDSIDARTGRVRILLDDKDIFEPDNKNCLTVAPNVAGTVRFSTH